MKKAIAFLLILCMCLVMVGCSIEDAPTKETNSTDTTSSAPANETFSLNDSAVFSSLKFTATKIEESKGKDYFTPDKGNVFVGIKFTIENISDEEQSVSSLLSFSGYVDDIKTDYSFSAACVFTDGTLDGTIAPGKKLVGWFPVEVPQDWETIEVVVTADIFSNATATFVFENSK